MVMLAAAASGGVSGAGALEADGTPRLSGFDVRMSERLDDVRDAWTALEARGIDFPGQRLALIESWIAALAIPEHDCVFLLAEAAGRPLALLPLRRSRAFGARVVTWFTGDHLGASAPLVDWEAMPLVPPEGRAQIWTRMLKLVFGADLVHLPDVPLTFGAASGLAQALEAMPAADSVYQARFESWADCDAARRNKHRRKVDRQQGAKLEALGASAFETVYPGLDADGLIDTMFAQKAARFRVQGIRDPFAAPEIRAFYKDVFGRAGGVLHVLRLDGEPVAVRYNLGAGNGLFSLISSMSMCERIQGGSPGKQNLLRVMQGVFEAGYRFIDMGRGENDEKRLWCNETVMLANYHHALTPMGRLAMTGHAARERARDMIKNNEGYFALAKRLRKMVAGGG